jgi:RNA polymerase sigma factor (sigma-70 family)
MDRDHDQEDLDPACQIVELLPALDTILHRLQRSYGKPLWCQRQIEDHFQNILLLLIKDDYRRLRSHDPRSSLDAWLYAIARRYLVDCLRGRILTGDWSDDLSGALRVEAKQEDEIIRQERLGRLREVFGQLSDQERLLGELLLSGQEARGLSLALGIEPHQVRKRRYALIKKVRKRLAEGGAGAGKK